MLFDIGDTAHIEITFADLAGTPTNPTTTTLTIQAPDNSTTTPSPTNDSAGNFHYDLALTMSGLYRFKWTGTGTIAAVQEGEIAVKPSILVQQPPGSVFLKTLIDAGLRRAGLMDAARRLASKEQLDEGTECFNEMMDTWRAQSWLIPCTSRVLLPLVAGQKSYTIGPTGTGADLTQPRPARITQAGLVLLTQDPNPEWELPVYSAQQYDRIRNKDWTVSWPTACYYEPTYAAGKGTLYVYPKPSSATAAVALYLEQAISEVQGLTTSLLLPPGHRKAIVDNLGMMLVGRNPKTAHPGKTLERDAREGLDIIAALNYRPTDKKSDFPGRPTRSNIYDGGFRRP